MTNLAYLWKGKALSALVFVLTLPGLSGCMSTTPTLGESSVTSNVDVDPWPRRLTSGETRGNEDLGAKSQIPVKRVRPARAW